MLPDTCTTFENEGRIYYFAKRMSRLAFMRLIKQQDEVQAPYLPGDCLVYEQLRDADGAKYTDIDAAIETVDMQDYGDLLSAIKKSCGLTVETDDTENPTTTMSD